MTHNVLKQIPKDFSACWPVKLVDHNLLHAMHLNTYFTCDDTKVQVTVILQHMSNSVVTMCRHFPILCHFAQTSCCCVSVLHKLVHHHSGQTWWHVIGPRLNCVLANNTTIVLIFSSGKFCPRLSDPASKKFHGPAANPHLNRSGQHIKILPGCLYRVQPTFSHIWYPKEA